MSYYIYHHNGWLTKPPIELVEGEEIETVQDLRKACCVSDEILISSLSYDTELQLVAYRASAMNEYVQHILPKEDLPKAMGIQLQQQVTIRDMSKGITQKDLQSTKAFCEKLLAKSILTTWDALRWELNTNLFYAISTEFSIPLHTKLRDIHITPEKMSIQLQRPEINERA